MFNWLKKRCRKKHGKRIGEPFPENMQEVARFSPYSHEIDSIGYGIHECRECGHRMFSCIGCHMMGPTAEQTIDAFIEHKISIQELAIFLGNKMAWCRINYCASATQINAGKEEK